MFYFFPDYQPKGYQSTDTGDVRYLKTMTTPQLLYLKVDAPVILTVDLTDVLVNGTIGKISKMFHDHVNVMFEGQTTETKIKIHTFSMFHQHTGTVVATRQQMPLNLAWAVTMGKAHGLTQPQPSTIEPVNTCLSTTLSNDRSCCSQEVIDKLPTDCNDDDDDTDFREQEHVMVDHQTENLQQLPNYISISEILKRLNFSDPLTEPQQMQNKDIQFLFEHPDKAKEIFLFIFNQLHSLFSEMEMTSNVKSSKVLNGITVLCGSSYYRDMINKIFNQDSHSKFRTSFSILQALRLEIIKKLTPVQPTTSTQPFHAFEISDAGRGTIRHIGGWVVGKLKQKKINYVKRNLFKKSTFEQVHQTNLHVRALDKLTASEESLLRESADIASLKHTQSRQNERKSLTNIKDETFSFFMHLDAAIHPLQTEEQVNIHGAKLYNVLFQKLIANKPLIDEWRTLFTSDDTVTISNEIKINLYREVIIKYLNMSCAQFRRDHKRKEAVKKQKALRKRTEKSSISEKKFKGAKKSKSIEYPCGVCGDECEDSICCDKCNVWHHFNCVGLSGKENYSSQCWVCPKCHTLDKPHTDCY